MSYFKGDVKWFNNKAGYGFITVVEDASEISENLQMFAPFVGKDIFVHHSVINVKKSVFRYLMPEEQVQFTITVPEGGKHDYQASSVYPLDNNDLKCETRESFVRKRRAYPNTKTLQKESTETPVVEPPVVETPVVETPVVETPVVETP